MNAFLSWKAFIPLSRLTYCTYLVHPLVIWWFIAGETLIHYSIQIILAYFLGKWRSLVTRTFASGVTVFSSNQEKRQGIKFDRDGVEWVVVAAASLEESTK